MSVEQIGWGIVFGIIGFLIYLFLEGIAQNRDRDEEDDTYRRYW